MKKIIAVLATIALICCLCTAVNAVEGEEDVNVLTSHAIETTALPEETSLPVTETIVPETETIAPDTMEGGLAEDVGGTENPSFGEWVQSILSKHSTKIIAAISAIICGVVAIAQKYKLFPAINAFISTITKAIFGDENSDSPSIMSYIKDIRSDVEVLCSRHKETHETAAAALALCEELKKEVDLIKRERDNAQRDRDIVKKLMQDQIEMFNTIVQSSSMAQWRKDEIGLICKNNARTVEEMEEKKNVSVTEQDTAAEDGEENV